MHPQQLSPALVRSVQAALETTQPPHWIDADRAVDIPFEGPTLAQARLVLKPIAEQADIIVQSVVHRSKRLLVADMDSTMISCECIDELADFAGLKPQVAAVTERAMRGELDFAGALRERVALLEGLGTGAIDTCLRERVRPTEGARTLVATMHARGARTLLVSGGFTAFAEPVGRALGFDLVAANRLESVKGKLTGRVETPILDAEGKRRLLFDEACRNNLTLADTLAVGDGANDIPMLQAAGLGVAYRGKPAAVAAADAAIRLCDLTALLHAQGIPSSEWVH